MSGGEGEPTPEEVATLLRLADFAMQQAQIVLVAFVPSSVKHVEWDYERLAEVRRQVAAMLDRLPPEPPLTDEQMEEAATVIRAALNRRFGGSSPSPGVPGGGEGR